MDHWLIQRIANFDERPCLVRGGTAESYRDLLAEIQATHRHLREAGVRAGDVVTLESDYSLPAVAALLALFELRAVAAPLTVTSDREIESRIRESRAVHHLSFDETSGSPRLKPTGTTEPPHELVARLRDLAHPGLILFSSGSTGTPKAMVHDAERLLEPFVKKRARRLHILIFLLFDHIGGLNTLFNGLASGAKIVIPESREADTVARAIATHEVHLLPASPTFLNLLLLSGAAGRHDLSSLRFITYGTEPMPASLLTRLKDAFPQVNFIQTFGTSETGISQTVSRSSNSTQIKIDDPNTEYRIVEGELWLRSRSQILGYLNHDMSRFTDDGWFKTGDLVEKEEDGFLTISGRREDLINVGGEKVTPSEVESVLLDLPEVADCLVYGEPNALTGQNVAAQVVPRDADADPRQLKRRIKQHCRRQLSPYKVPARIVLAEATLWSERFKKSRQPPPDTSP